MSRLNSIKHQAAQRKLRIRSTISGTSERPRLTVSISNRHITAQIIDDEKQKTLVYVTTVGLKNNTGTMTERAAKLGVELAKKAKVIKITKVVLDRGSHLYHGRIKALADTAREGGLEF
jgi:large subunit ribosomal protein L18